MEPEGANFNPPILCTFLYRDNELLEGADETRLTIMRWRPIFRQWYALPSVVDPVKNTVTTEIGYFSMYTLMLVPRPATFELSQLEITPDEIATDEEVTISVLVTNKGDFSGDYELTLKINYRTAEVKTVTLAGGESYTARFSVSQKLAGRYTVDINGISGVFTVRSQEEPEPEVPTTTEPLPEPEAPPTTVATAEPEIPEVTIETDLQPTADETADTGAESRWWIFVILIIVLVVMATALFLVIRRQKPQYL